MLQVISIEGGKKKLLSFQKERETRGGKRGGGQRGNKKTDTRKHINLWNDDKNKY